MHHANQRLLAIAALAGALNAPAVESAPSVASERCAVRLSLRLTPDAARPTDPGFLNALVADPRYELRWIEGDDSAAVVELSGPGSDAQCSEGIGRLDRSSHVIDAKVLAPGVTQAD